jgi:hypothetical protein
MNPAIAYSLLAGAAAVIAECVYVRWTAPWWHGLHFWIPIQLVIGYCVYRLVTAPSMSLLDAFVMFALATAAMRVIAAVWVLDQDIRPGAWAAFGLLIAANIIRAYWR